jgi:hypothetical protein
LETPTPLTAYVISTSVSAGPALLLTAGRDDS